MTQIQLSVVLATYNEVANLGKCLRSIKNLADEIVIVDGSSQDQTREVAKTFSARVYKVNNLPMFHTNKQIAVDRAKGAWVLQLDADEVVTPDLKQEILDIVRSDHGEKSQRPIAYYIPRKNFFLGRPLTKGGQYPDYVIRLFRRGQAHFPQASVHEQPTVNGQVGYLIQPLLHYTAPTFSRYLTNANRYTSLTAQELNRQKIKFTWFNLLNYLWIKPTLTFFSLYFHHKGFVDGMPGFIFALFSGLHWPLAYMKYWEIKHVRSTKI